MPADINTSGSTSITVIFSNMIKTHILWKSYCMKKSLADVFLFADNCVLDMCISYYIVPVHTFALHN